MVTGIEVACLVIGGMVGMVGMVGMEVWMYGGMDLELGIGDWGI